MITETHLLKPSIEGFFYGPKWVHLGMDNNIFSKQLATVSTEVAKISRQLSVQQRVLDSRPELFETYLPCLESELKRLIKLMPAKPVDLSSTDYSNITILVESAEKILEYRRKPLKAEPKKLTAGARKALDKFVAKYPVSLQF